MTEAKSCGWDWRCVASTFSRSIKVTLRLTQGLFKYTRVAWFSLFCKWIPIRADDLLLTMGICLDTGRSVDGCALWLLQLWIKWLTHPRIKALVQWPRPRSSASSEPRRSHRRPLRSAQRQRSCQRDSQNGIATKRCVADTTWNHPVWNAAHASGLRLGQEITLTLWQDLWPHNHVFYSFLLQEVLGQGKSRIQRP